MTENTWQIFDLEELARKVDGNEPRFHEFLRVPTLSCAIYRLPAGASDMQAPHLEDEIYIVLSGRARLKIDDKVHEIRKDTVLFVRATAKHSFFDIEEDLTVLALFGAAKS